MAPEGVTVDCHKSRD